MKRVSRTAAWTALVSVVLTPVACGTSSDSSSSTTTVLAGASSGTSGEAIDGPVGTDQALGEVATSTNSLSSSTTRASASPLEGTWTASIQDLIAGASGGGATAGGLTCTGNVNYTFRSGDFRTSGGGECVAGPTQATVQYDTTANYTATSDEITFTNMNDNSKFTMNGVSTDGFGSELGNGTVGYVISGNTLTATINDPDIGQLSMTLTRVP